MRARTQPQRREEDDASASDLSAEQQEAEYVINRITVGIIPRAWSDLQRLITDTRYNRTDVVNRAISVYAMVNDNLREGSELIFRDPESGIERIVEIL